jgi:hypothetical protein
MTMRMLRTCFPALLLLSMAPLPAPAAGYDAGFQFVEEPVDARLIAMGCAGTAVGGHGFYYYNPAQPALNANHYLSLEYGQQTGDLRRADVEGAWHMRSWFMALGVPTSTIADIYPADERGVRSSIPFSSQGTQVALSAGYRWKGLGVALCLVGMQDRIDVNSGYAVTLAAGATYRLLSERLSLGVAGFYPRSLTATRGMLSKEWDGQTVINRTARAGAAWSDSLKTIPYTVALDVVYNDALENVSVPVGLEVWPLRMLAIRIGKRINHDTDKFNFGLGLRFAPITFDASFVITRWVDDTGLKWQMGLAYSLPAGWKSR